MLNRVKQAAELAGIAPGGGKPRAPPLRFVSHRRQAEQQDQDGEQEQDEEQELAEEDEQEMSENENEQE